MALNPCVKRGVCTLSAPVLVALRTAVTAAIVQLNAQRIVAAAAQAVVGSALDRVQSELDAVYAEANEISNVFGLVARSAIVDCVQLGDLLQKIHDTYTGAASSTADLTAEVARASNLAQEKIAELAAIDTALEQFNQLIDAIDECIAESANT